MRIRSLLGAGAVMGGVITITSCAVTPALTSITISPTSFTTTLALDPSGAPAPTAQQLSTQFTALGSYTRPGHAAVTRDITNQVTWLSYTPALVTISNAGVATVAGGAIGTSQIAAAMPGFHGYIQSPPSTYTVSLPANAGKTSDVITLTVTPANPVILVGQNAGFTAIGTTGNGGSENLTDVSVWTSSNPTVCAINAATGVCTSTGAGIAAITATYTNPDGIKVTGYTTLSVQVLGQQAP